MKKKQIYFVSMFLCVMLLICSKQPIKLNNGLLLDNVEALSEQLETTEDAQCIKSGNVKCPYSSRMVKTNFTFRLEKEYYMY